MFALSNQNVFIDKADHRLTKWRGLPFSDLGSRNCTLMTQRFGSNLDQLRTVTPLFGDLLRNCGVVLDSLVHFNHDLCGTDAKG